MPMKPGNFAWYDLMTTDAEAAASFYRSVIGWEAAPAGVPEHAYSILSMGPTKVGGIMPISESACTPDSRPCWLGYINVSDVDDTTRHVKAAGGSVQREPEDIPGILRFSVVADPHGAAFILFKGKGDAQPTELAPDAPGNIGWHELYAGDGESAFDFYSSLFGWTKTEAMDMGAAGVYQLFSMGGDTPAGGIMTKPPEIPAPFWLFYFIVERIDDAIARTTENGGKVLMGPHQVPGESWVVQCLDPQGAMFAMVAPQR